MLDRLTIDEVIGRTFDIYRSKYYHEFTYGETTYIINTDPAFTSVLEDIIFDNGLLYLTDFQDYAEVWEMLVQRHQQSKDTYQYNLLNLVTIFRCKCFADKEEYKQWVGHIAESITINTSDTNGNELALEPTNKFDTAYVTLEDDDFHRLHKITDMRGLLGSNPWIVFLITLSMSVDDIIAVKNTSKTMNEITRTIEQLNTPQPQATKSKELMKEPEDA